MFGTVTRVPKRLTTVWTRKGLHPQVHHVDVKDLSASPLEGFQAVLAGVEVGLTGSAV